MLEKYNAREIANGCCHKKGFALVEVMMVLVILAVLAQLAIPGFFGAFKRYQISSIKDELEASIQLGRIEAVRRGLLIFMRRTVVCDKTLVSPDDWSCGWDTVVDSDASYSLTASDQLLQTYSLPPGFSLMQPGLGGSLRVNQWGQISGVGRRFVVSPAVPSGESDRSTTVLCISSGDRLLTTTGSSVCP